jgi:glycine hydroxymethyltransferase
MHLLSSDPLIDSLISKETERQQNTIDLIASENYASRDVLAATGSVLTNKYAEGYPKKRYYAGCAVVDEVEQLAIDRCKQLFGAPHANVQPHAGSQANMAAYFALLNPGDTILGMGLSAGGHLTHGHPVNFSGKLFNAIQYTVDKETEQFDYQNIADLAQQHKPKLIIVGASAYSRTIDFTKFKDIAESVGALLLADIAHIAGLIAAGIHPSPIGIADVVTSTTHKTLRGPRGGLIMSSAAYADAIDKTIIPGMQGGPLLHVIAAKAVAFKEALEPAFKTYQQQIVANACHMATLFADRGYRIVADGTDNHLMTLDLRSKKITGKEAEILLESAGIITNRNCIPFDPEKPWITSGLRLGTPAVTTRGMQENEITEIVELIDLVITKRDSETVQKVASHVLKLCKNFPIYQK